MRRLVTCCVLLVACSAIRPRWHSQLGIARTLHYRVALAGNPQAAACFAACDRDRLAACLARCPGAETKVGSCDPVDRPPTAACAETVHRVTVDRDGRCAEQHEREDERKLSCTDTKRMTGAGIVVAILALALLGLIAIVGG